MIKNMIFFVSNPPKPSNINIVYYLINIYEEWTVSVNASYLGLKRRLGITAWREFSEDMTQGLKNLQDSATYKRTAENIQFAKEIAKEKTSGMVANITSSGYFQSVSSAFGAAKTKISSSMSQQSFNDVLNEQNGGQPATTPTAEQKQ